MNAPFACDASKSRGRIFSASVSPTRSEYQRDRDRIIHSTAFRRLQHKTQVFLHHEGHHFRTRLTHTLEVSQIARSIARALRVDEDLAEAVALAHDLGHTPFGHAGERALARCMEGHGGFDHNVQALRTVMLLENRYADHDGLNLTWETLEGMLKHNGPLSAHERSLLDFLPDELDLPFSGYSGLEAQAAAIADDIAYNAHDIDDALRAGLISLSDLAEVPLVGTIVQEVLEKYPDIDPHRQAHEVQRRLITRTIEEVIAEANARIDLLGVTTVDDVRAADKPIVAFPDQMAGEEKALKRFMFEKVYRAPTVLTPVKISERVVERLFGEFVLHGNLPKKWEMRAESAASDVERARIVSDYIAGMTDPYALAEYRRLFDERIDFS